MTMPQLTLQLQAWYNSMVQMVQLNQKYLELPEHQLVVQLSQQQLEQPNHLPVIQTIQQSLQNQTHGRISINDICHYPNSYN